jgi:hypothetical protein
LGREVGGIIISRRPKSLASTENKPGPNMAIEREMAIISNDAGLHSMSLLAGKTIHEIEIKKTTSATTTFAIGVNSPISTHMPEGMSSAALANDIHVDRWARQIIP